MKYGVIVFPGSNCDHDAITATSVYAGAETVEIWHKDTSIPDAVDCIIIPGGFSFGDYLRSGAIARVSPIMKEVIKFANNGGHVLGICNGFQILTEAGLLPGTLQRNESIHFICKDVHLRTINNDSVFTTNLKKADIIRIPIAHQEGNYFAEPETIAELEDNNRVVFRYCDENGNITKEANPNGSINNIAGIINKKGNVLGMMPHPERCCDPLLGCADGLAVFESLNTNLSK